LIDAKVLGAILLDMYEFAPVAISISTTGKDSSRYVSVNRAYLEMVGKTWDELRNQELVDAGAAISNPERDRRLALLDEAGFYRLEEVPIRHASGAVIPTLISAWRGLYRGEKLDIEIILDVSDRVRMQKELEGYLKQAALTDPLTGLPNRAHFDQHLELSLKEAPPHGEVVALAFLDLNGFKRVNDQFGHETGDAVLKVIAERLRLAAHGGDFVARLGGDEMALLFRVAPQTISELAQRLSQLLAEVFQPIETGGERLAVGAACGLSVQGPGQETALELVRAADRQMYLAKATRARIALRCEPLHTATQPILPDGIGVDVHAEPG
jgi:diguanylate cyclase (GGDEF)-like protein/PAS domain S-box-containing protein